ncbi:hypothetical protein [uncultured Brachyspira sp.]|uniref:hypothetical protein n=1 Tax=uncultured Brachyspira sp. TaxID=221953 RepID=UPI00320B0AA6
MIQEEITTADKECIAVRLLAEYPDTDSYIYLMFFIDKDSLKLIDSEIMVSNNYDFFILLNEVKDLFELYRHIEVAIEANKNLIIPCDKLKDDINKILKDRINRVGIVNYLSKKDIIPIIDLFADTLNSYMDFNIGIYDVVYKIYPLETFKTFIEKTKDDIENKRVDFDKYNFYSNAEYEIAEEVEESITDKYEIINASLVVSPVNGKPINEVKLGDKIVVSINSNLFEEDMVYLDSHGKKDVYSKYLVPGEIIEKSVTEESTTLTIKLSERCCAIIEEVEPIKLRMFNPEKDTYVAPPVISMNERINLIAKFFDNISIFNLIMFGLGITSLFILTYILYIMLTT